MNAINKLLIGGVVFGCLLIASCNKAPEPNEYVTHLDRFFTFSKKELILTNKEIMSTSNQGFADFTGDNIKDMFEIRDIESGELEFKLWLFEGYVNSETKLLNFSDPYSIEIKGEKELKWSKSLKFDTADINGDGRADIVLSQHIENWGDDEFNLIVLLNKGIDHKTRKISFQWVNDIFDKEKGNIFNTSFLNFISEREAEKSNFCLGNSCSTSNRYTLHWADMDSNGADDLVVFWRESSEDPDLIVDVFYTNAPIPSTLFERLTFAYHDDFLLPKIFNDDNRSYFSLTNIEVDDFNGDGFGDLIFVVKKSNETVLLKFALNTSSLRKYEGLSFMTDPTTEYPEIDWNLLTDVADKVNTLDVNFDGCADYTHIGQSSYFPLESKKKEIENAKTMYYMLTDCEKAKSLIHSLHFSKNLIGVKWPLDRIPKEQEKVIGFSPPTMVKK